MAKRLPTSRKACRSRALHRRMVSFEMVPLNTVMSWVVIVTSFGFFRIATNVVAPGGSKRPKRYRGLIPLSGVVFVALPTLIGVVIAHIAITKKGIKKPTHCRVLGNQLLGEVSTPHASNHTQLGAVVKYELEQTLRMGKICPPVL